MNSNPNSEPLDAQIIKLTSPRLNGSVSLEQAIARRRSIREFSEQPLTIEQLSQLLWSVQGVTNSQYLRASPSAGATFPLEIIAVVGVFSISALPAGCFQYLPGEHGMKPLRSGDLRLRLTGAALGQQAITLAPVTFIICADYERTRSRYRNRTERYVHMEAGHAAQNLYLQATTLGLGTTAIGAFDDNEVKEVLSLPGNLDPLYVLPIGYPD